jgi:hypothetical protein
LYEQSQASECSYYRGRGLFGIGICSDSKGSFKDVNIREVMSEVRGHGLNIKSNYIFGFPDDTVQAMRETLDLALELCAESLI